MCGGSRRWVRRREWCFTAPRPRDTQRDEAAEPSEPEERRAYERSNAASARPRDKSTRFRACAHSASRAGGLRGRREAQEAGDELVRRRRSATGEREGVQLDGAAWRRGRHECRPESGALEATPEQRLAFVHALVRRRFREIQRAPDGSERQPFVVTQLEGQAQLLGQLRERASKSTEELLVRDTRAGRGRALFVSFLHASNLPRPPSGATAALIEGHAHRGRDEALLDIPCGAEPRETYAAVDEAREDLLHSVTREAVIRSHAPRGAPCGRRAVVDELS